MRRAFAWVRKLFWLELAITLVLLLSPASAILTFKIWLASWVPMAETIDAMDATANFDKVVHCTLFLLLGFLAVRSWKAGSERRRLFVALLLLGVVTEILQAFVPGRDASIFDLMADTLGLCLGMFLGAPASMWPWRQSVAAEPTGPR